MAGEKVQVTGHSAITEVLEKFESEILTQWVSEQMGAIAMRRDLLKESQLWEQSRRFLSVLRLAAQSGTGDIATAPWSGVRDVLGDLSRERAAQGFTPSETATFVLSLKQPLFSRLRTHIGDSRQTYEEPSGPLPCCWTSWAFTRRRFHQEPGRVDSPAAN